MICPDFSSSLEPQGSSLEAESPQEQISALGTFMAWLQDFGGSQAHQLHPGTSQTGLFAVQLEKGLVETPLAPIFGSSWAEGLQPGLCEATWSPDELRGLLLQGLCVERQGWLRVTSIPPSSFSLGTEPRDVL